MTRDTNRCTPPRRGRWLAGALLLLVMCCAGQAWGGFGVGVYLGEFFDEWVPAPDSGEVSGTVTVRYTCDGDPPYQDAFFIALPPGGDEPSDWRCIPGWTPVGPLPAGGQHAVSEEIRTAIWRDGTWEVWVALARWIEEGKDGGDEGGVESAPDPDVPFPSGVFPPEDPPFMIVDAVLGPFHFTAKNLSISSFDVDDTMATPNPSTVVDEREPFVGVAGAGLLGHALDFTLTLADGTEIPTVAPVSGLAGLVPLTGGSLHGEPVSAPDAPVPIDGTWSMVFDGLYYKTVGSTSVPSHVVDDASAPYLTPFLGLESMTKTGFTLTGPRAGCFSLSVERDDAFAASTPVSDSLYVWHWPAPTSSPSGEYRRVLSRVDGDTPDILGELDTAVLATGPETFELAGAYTLGVSLKDGCAELHRDGQSRWCRPVVTSLDVPASAHFSGNGEEPWEGADFADMAADAYGHLGCVCGQLIGLGPASFYSGRAPLGERGGVVNSSPQRARFLEACWEDQVIHFSGHGGYPFCDDPECVCHTDYANRTPCPDPSHLNYRPFRLVLSHGVESNSVVTGDFDGHTMPQARIVVLMSCHQLRPGGLGHTMKTCMGDSGAVIGYNGLGSPLFASHDMGIEWINDRLWEHLANGTCAQAAVSLTIVEWANAHPGWDLSDFELDNLDCLGNATIAPAF